MLLPRPFVAGPPPALKSIDKISFAEFIGEIEHSENVQPEGWDEDWWDDDTEDPEVPKAEPAIQNMLKGPSPPRLGWPFAAPSAAPSVGSWVVAAPRCDMSARVCAAGGIAAGGGIAAPPRPLAPRRCLLPSAPCGFVACVAPAVVVPSDPPPRKQPPRLQIATPKVPKSPKAPAGLSSVGPSHCFLLSLCARVPDAAA